MDTEAQLREEIAYLGWFYDLRDFIIYLPSDKFLGWRCEINNIIQEKVSNRDYIKSLFYKLNHDAYVAPRAHYLLNNL